MIFILIPLYYLKFLTLKLELFSMNKLINLCSEIKANEYDFILLSRFNYAVFILIHYFIIFFGVMIVSKVAIRYLTENNLSIFSFETLLGAIWTTVR